MEKLITTPHDFIWRVIAKNYWANSLEEVKYIVYVDGEKLGGFYSVNRTFDDDFYYINFFDENNNFSYRKVFRDAEMILEPINSNFKEEVLCGTE